MNILRETLNLSEKFLRTYRKKSSAFGQKCGEGLAKLRSICLWKGKFLSSNADNQPTNVGHLANDFQQDFGT